jgi:hypothetical protein
MTVHLEYLDEKPACFVVPLYRTTFVEQPLIGSVTIKDQDWSNEKRKLNLGFFLGILHFWIFPIHSSYYQC